MKFLIVRFSSFGDVLQCLSVAGAIRREHPDAEIHWLTRADMAPLIQNHPAISKVWSVPQKSGLTFLWQIASQLRHESYTHYFDAHNNLRSLIISWLVAGPFGILHFLRGQKYLRRSQYRWKRFLLFQFRINLYEKPFNGQKALLKPLEKWGMQTHAPEPPQLFLESTAKAKAEASLGTWAGQSFIALAPSAAFELKRWPIKYWQELIAQFPEKRFVILGGPKDDFLNQLTRTGHQHVLNLAGQLSLLESAAVVERAQLLVANDTGLLHVAEQLGIACIALMGPAPFGFPSRAKTKIMQIDLPCRPCSKHGQGPCVNKKFHQCLVDITPAIVASQVRAYV